MMRSTTRRGGRKSNQRQQNGFEQMPFLVLKNQDLPIEPIRPDELLAMDKVVMRILSEIGIKFLNEEALTIFAQSRGCKVKGELVFFETDFVREMLKLAPSSFTLHAKNPKHNIPIGEGHMAFVNVSSPPNSHNIDRGRKVGDFESFEDFIKLTQSFNCIHLVGGYPVEPIDIHASIRHLDCLYAKFTLTDKFPHAYSLGAERVEDALEMARIWYDESAEEFCEKPRILTNINSTSPLKHDHPMIDGALRFARASQPVIVTPFTLAGAMAPITMAGAVAQCFAEAIAAIVLLQIVNPGTPCMIGSFTSNVDMKSGSPAFGTPEYIRATQMSGQLARFYGLPLRASNACAATNPDQQAIYESMQSLWACSTSHVNLVYHAAGWLEGGLIASYEKFVMDCEVLQQFQAYHDPKTREITEDILGFEAIKTVGHDGHFFGIEHTQSRYETEYYAPFLSDWRTYEAWEASGSQTALMRANKIWKNILNEFTPPALDDGIKDALTDFVQKRKSEGGAHTDF